MALTQVQGGMLAGSTNTTTTIQSNGTTAITIDSSQNVGIGTTTPTQKLNVAGFGAFSGANRGVTLGEDNCLILGDSATLNSAQMRFYTANTERGRFDTSGNFSFNSGYGSVAVAYGCRAWVNFNGTGSIAIRGSGNVSSLVDGGIGNYSINMTTAMPDTNYAAIGAGGISGDYTAVKTTVGSTTQFNVDITNDGRSWTDALYVFGAVFR